MHIQQKNQVLNGVFSGVLDFEHVTSNKLTSDRKLTSSLTSKNVFFENKYFSKMFIKKQNKHQNMHIQ